MGAASARSRPLPAARPSATSTRATSAKSRSRIRWAHVPPTFPAPMMPTFARAAMGSTPLVERDILPLPVPHVDLARPANLHPLGLEHLLPVGQPSRQPTQGEDDRELLGGNPDRPQDDPAVEIHVRVELAADEVFVLQGRLLQPLGNVQQRVLDPN